MGAPARTEDGRWIALLPVERTWRTPTTNLDRERCDVPQSAGGGATGETRQRSALPLETTFGHLIRRAQQVHTALWTAQFDGDLTGPQYAVLAALSQHGTMDQRTAGHLASLDKSTAADVIARLQRHGWLDRDRDPDDGRRNLLTLTGAARAALRHLTPGAIEVQRRLLEPLDAAGRTWFIQHLAVVAYAGDPPPPPRPDGRRPGTLRLEEAPGHLIRRAEQLHGVHWGRLVGPVLTPSQYGLLTAVAWQPAIDQSEAGDSASLDRSSTADITARLIGRGLLVRTQDDRDRRRKLLGLTERAWSTLAVAAPPVRTLQRRLTEPLSRTDAERLTSQLHTVAYR